MLQKGCECRQREVEELKQNWDELFMDEAKRERERERGDREREREKERGKREKK
jgi:hypothetical protein